MGTVPRLAVFVLGLLAAFGAAFGLGRVVGPVGDEPTPVPVTTTVHGGHS